MEVNNQEQALLAVDPILSRAAQVEDAMGRAAQARRQSFERLTEQVKELAVVNGDLNDRVEALEGELGEAQAQHAKEVTDLLARIQEMEAEAVRVAGVHASEKSAAAERERALNAELSRTTEAFSRTVKEFERFLESVGRDTVAAVEAADQAERNLVGVTVRVPEVASRPTPDVRLKSANNLIQMPRPVIGADADDADTVIGEAFHGFGRMLGGNS